MSKIMYITLIAVGVILIIVGVVGLSKPAEASIDIPDFETVSVVDAANPDTEAVVEDVYPNPDPQEDTSYVEADIPENKSSKEESTKTNGSAPQNGHQSLTGKEKGNLFEGYVADCFKDRESFRVLEWNQGVTSPEGVYAENNVNPDFHIEQVYAKDYNIDYYVEAKYLSHWGTGYTIQLKEYQIDRYRRHQGATHRKVLLAIGVGGEPASPADFYLVPLDSIKTSELAKSFLDRFAVTQNGVKDYITKYFRDSVFRKASTRKH